MTLSVRFSPSFKDIELFGEGETKEMQGAWQLFKKTIDSEETGFFHANNNKELRDDSKRVFGNDSRMS